MFGELKREFEENAPDWLYAFVGIFYLNLHPHRERITIIPHGDLWILVYRGLRLFAPKEKNLPPRYLSTIYREYCKDGFEAERDNVVLDVGASMGWFTIPATLKVGGTGMVIAVEPEPTNLAFLKVNVSKLDNVLLVEKCVWNRKGKIKLFAGPTTLTHSVIRPHFKSNYVWVQADTLDNIVSELGVDKVDFIKIDVEGAELEVLEGAERVLKNAKRVAVAAYHARGEKQTWPEVKRVLEQKGFKTEITSQKIVRAWKP